jgi:hypothetical protein
MTEQTAFEGWAIVELMGHRRLAGYVTETQIAGQGFIRLDVPGYLYTDPTGAQAERDQVTQFYAPAAVYAITPTTEELARAVRSRPAPVHAFELPSGRGVVDDQALDDDDEEISF